MTSGPSHIKVCGVRDAGDAAALDEMGVDWIGFNFHPASARYISPEAAAPIIAKLKRAIPVGVFVDADPVRVSQIVLATGVRYAQLHGSEDWAYVQSMPIPVIKAIPHNRLSDLAGFEQPLAWGASHQAATPLTYFLVDTLTQSGSNTGAFGGSGQSFDWNLLNGQPLPLPFFLAGGLGPHNLKQALGVCKPFAVDLNSKVEIAPGKKDLDKVKACLEIVSGFNS